MNTCQIKIQNIRGFASRAIIVANGVVIDSAIAPLGMPEVARQRAEAKATKLGYEVR